jgi:large subunit ribosomal protein L6
MSRIGKQPIAIPDKTEISVSEDGLVTVKGPLGQLTRNFRPNISISIQDGKVVCVPREENLSTKALWGTYASHITNMIKGVNQPFERKLIIEGVGFKVAVSGKSLVLNIGFSHPVIIDIPDDLTVGVEKNVITVSGIDKERVGQFAARVRALKKPEPYKGKGIRYENEVIRRKQGKKSV